MFGTSHPRLSGGAHANRRKGQPLGRSKRYQARLTESGLAVRDSIVLCAEYRLTGHWDEVKSKALKENLLAKGSRSRISKLVRAVERRIFAVPPPLRRPAQAARFLAAEAKVPAAAKAQLLFVLALMDDKALADAFRALVVPAVIGAVSRILPTARDPPLPQSGR